MICYKVNSRLFLNFTPLVGRSQRHISAVANTENKTDLINQDEEISSVPNQKKLVDINYPPIEDLSALGRLKKTREEWYTKVKKLGTVEEKIFELNMPKYYGWKAWNIQEGVIPYHPLPQAQYMTRTYLASIPGLPSYYDNILSPGALDAFVQRIKNQIEEALIFEYSNKKQDYQYSSVELEDQSFRENLMAKSISQQFNRILTINLSPDYSHLIENQLDIEPRVEAIWWFGGLDLPVKVLKLRYNHKYLPKDIQQRPCNQYLKYTGNPILHLRHNLPLKEIVSLKNSEDDELEVPKESIDPGRLGYFTKLTRATIIPGFWPGDYSEFGTISYHSKAHLATRPKQYNDNDDAIISQAIFGSFSWLYAQACYQGFSTFQDPTYPLVNQMIITNGQWWSFAVYQLNTTALHIDNLESNPRRNMCWITKPMKLFDSIENGKVNDLNEEVIKHLIKFYVNVPEAKEGVEMRPYLSEEKTIAGIKEPERRIWLEKQYKHLMSNRPRHRLMPEIKHWQWIYMIKNKTFFIDKKRDPWEFGKNAYQRRLDDHTPQYVPKSHRSTPKNKKEKWAKTYYPAVRNDTEDNS